MSQETSPDQGVLDEEYRFLLCERCQEDIKTPKLLPCLHNLCTTCLEENKPIGLCPICGTAHSQNAESPQIQDNLLFANLQAKLSIYQKVVGSKRVICDNCKKDGEFWCSECEEFICPSCFESHQRYLKRESHEAKPLKDLRTESSKEFLAGIRKQSVIFCSKKDHKMHNLSIYCNECKESMCCVCALLDSKHMGRHSDIQTEIKRRQEELQNMSTELKKKKGTYDEAFNGLLELLGNMEKEKNETREQIQQKINEMVQMLQEKGGRFLAEVEDHHKQQVQEVMRRLQDMEGVVKRMESSEKLVEKMHLYATDQELLEMHPFIKRSLEELGTKPPPATHFQIQVGKFTEINSQLQALLERVAKDNEVVPVRLETQPEQVDGTMNCNAHDNLSCTSASVENASHTSDHAQKSPAKRKHVQEENAIQTPPKLIKTEPEDSEWKEAGSTSLPEQPGTSSESAGSDHAMRNGSETLFNSKWFPSSSSETSGEKAVLSEWRDALPLADIFSEEDISDVESAGSSLLKDISETQSSQEELMRQPSSKAQELDVGEGTLVFFDLKLLPGKVLHLVVAVDETNSFSVVIQPLLSSPTKHMTSGLCEIGLDSLLNYFHSLHRPILVGYKIWSMELPELVKTLQDINQEERFEASILGFLDAFPLIQETVPNITSYTLKNLDSIYLWGQLDDTQASECAKTLKDLCTVLDINPVVARKPVVAYSSLQCYTSLQPLLCEKLLSRTSVQTLALHNVSLFMLKSVHQNDPENGLGKLCRHLNARRRNGEKRIKKLQKIGSYLQSLLSVAWHPSPAATQCIPLL